jgi:hypothetical protein
VTWNSVMEYALKKLIVLGECCIEQGNAHLDTDIENEGPDSRIKKFRRNCYIYIPIRRHRLDSNVIDDSDVRFRNISNGLGLRYRKLGVVRMNGAAADGLSRFQK